ncbi:MAG: glycosyltransferase [Kiritimatiellae bacterium]|nr:glycosyltransferase [Kiritimatiellia bacterium]
MSITERSLLWWGRSDPAYSRNGVLRGHLSSLGWSITDFSPAFSGLADIEAALRRVRKPDLVWVPCFRQRDMAAARRWCDRLGVPLVFDPLISAYDKQVWERFKLKADSPAALKLLSWERGIFAKADLVIADTPCHARFFAETLGITPERARVVYVGADEGLFKPAAAREPRATAEVLFYGSFIPLHGAQTIIEAARVYQGPPVRWRLLGDGPAKLDCQKAAEGLANVVFEAPVPYADLPARVHRADILLGVFGTTMKAGRVIPNKVFQALAAGRPVVTRESDAYPSEAKHSDALAFVPPGDARALAAAVAAWLERPAELSGRGNTVSELYRECFSSAVICRQLRQALDESRL